MTWQQVLAWLRIVDDEPSREETLANIRSLRVGFEEAIKRAEAAREQSALDTREVLKEFSVIETAVADATDDDLEVLEDKAERLERLRAYVVPRAEIALEGKGAFADLSQWNVPAEILSTLRANTLELLSDSDEKVARGALRALYAEYDYWAWYVDWFADFMQTTAIYLLAAEFLTLAFAVYRFVSGDVILGFIAAGACGALVSVISKMPPLIADAESSAYMRRVLMRIGTGLAAAIIGGGFLASGVVTITLPGGTSRITDLLEQCGKPSHCTTGAFLLLIALGLVLGFSERALTSFEDRIFPAGRVEAK